MAVGFMFVLMGLAMGHEGAAVRPASGGKINAAARIMSPAAKRKTQTT